MQQRKEKLMLKENETFVLEANKTVFLEADSKIKLETSDKVIYELKREEDGILAIRAILKDLTNRELDERVFKKMSANDRTIVDKWLKQQREYMKWKIAGDHNERKRIHKQLEFLQLVEHALETIDYDYWISIIEPSIIKGKVEFIEEDTRIARGILLKEWEELYKEYAPNKNSRIATLFEVVLWYAWCMAVDKSEKGQRKSYKNLYQIIYYTRADEYLAICDYYNFNDDPIGKMFKLTLWENTPLEGHPVMVCTD